MSASSNYLEKRLLDHVLTTSSMLQPTSLQVALFSNTSDRPGVLTRLEAGTVTDEISTSGTGYTRANVAFTAQSEDNAAPGYKLSNNAALTFGPANSNWGTITHVAVMGTHGGSARVLFYGAVTTEKTIESGDTFQIATGALEITLS